MQTSEFEFPPFRNAPDVVGKFWEEVIKTDCEILQAVNDDGQIVRKNVGETNRVAVPEGCEGLWLMHSHPNCNGPLSLNDIGVIADNGVKMNMAVQHDGGISWTTGMMDPYGDTQERLFYFSQHPRTQSICLLLEHVAGEEIGGAAGSWIMLDFLTNKVPMLRDLHIKRGTDEAPWDLAVSMQCRLPREFSWRNPNVNDLEKFKDVLASACAKGNRNP